MKKKILYGISVLALGGASASIAAVGIGEGILDSVVATTGDYAINLSSSKNALTSEAASAGTASVLSEQGSDISLGLNGASASSGWGSLASSGYLYNTKIVHGLLGLTAAYEGGELTLYWSDVSIDPANLEGASSAVLTSGSAHSFGEDYPNYFLIKNTGDAVSEIASVSLSYDCALHPIEFGSYPQSEVTDDTLKSALSDLTADANGYVTYEGTKYLKTLGNGRKQYSDLSTNTYTIPYDSSTYYYFKVEPIVWDVYPDGTVISQKILNSMKYVTTRTDPRTIGTDSVHMSNYKYSTARAYLNGLDGSGYYAGNYEGTGFIDLAFTTAEQGKIEETEVDNSLDSMRYPGEQDPYICENTLDKIYLLSEVEVAGNTYFASDAERVRPYTDYACSQGFDNVSEFVQPDYEGKTASWWTRTPVWDMLAVVVTASGDPSNCVDVGTEPFGIVPAMKLAF